ncbi:hypothetical protein [Empedobacter sp.]|nr:hypothetical protein [Empedobacter sp.]
MQTTIGKVILAGAGHGDPELVTLKTLNYIKKSECYFDRSLGFSSVNR